MRRDYSAPTSDNAPHCTCDATTSPTTAQEHHHRACAVFDSSRARRAQDLAALAEHPAGHVIVRALDPAEDVEVADATGATIPTAGRERDRWRVAVTCATDGRFTALGGAILLDGEPVAALVDDAPAVAR